MAIGPVEFLVVAFPENRFTGEISHALSELVDSNTINVIDLAFVSKDTDGTTVALELDDLDSEIGSAFAKLGAGSGGLLNDEDLQSAADSLDPNTSAALLVWEDVWATRFAESLRRTGAVLLERELIPHEIVQAAADWAAEQHAVKA